MPEEGKTTIQFFTFNKGEKVVDRIWVENLKYSEHGVHCNERSNKNYRIFIPYTNIKMITAPNEGAR